MTDIIKTRMNRAILLFASLLLLAFLAIPAYAIAPPMPIYGYVTANGQHIAGITVTAASSTTHTDNTGYYQLTPAVNIGDTVTVTANYGGASASGTLTQASNVGGYPLNLDLNYTPIGTPTPRPTITPGPTLTVTPQPGAIITPTPVPSIVSTLSPTSTPTAAANPTQLSGEPSTPASAQVANPTIAPTITPLPTSESFGFSTYNYLVYALLIILIIAVVFVIFLLLRKIKK